MNPLKTAWKFLRKPTTPVHILFGLWVAFMIWQFGWLVGLVFMVGFMKWEVWNDQNEKIREALLGRVAKPEGDWDWWESAVPLCIALTPLGILKALGIIATIGWV